MTITAQRPRTSRVLPVGAPTTDELAAAMTARRLARLLVTGVGWATMAMTVVLFATESPLARFSDLGSALNSVGIIAGLVATNALVLMLLLAARVPLVDRALGQPAAVALHAKLGNWVVGGLAVHAAFVLIGGAVLDGADMFSDRAAAAKPPSSTTRSNTRIDNSLSMGPLLVHRNRDKHA